MGEFYNREMTFNAATNNTAQQHGPPVLAGRSDDGADQRPDNQHLAQCRSIGGTNASKRTHTITLAPRFEYKVGSWTFEGIAGYSRSFNNYEALEQGFARSETVNNLTSDWVATRPNIQSHEWTFTQTSGNDWFNLANFTNPRLTNEGRYARTEIYNGELSARWVAPFRRVPTVFKFGGKWAEEGRKNGNETSYYTWQYIGPGGGTTGSWGAIPTGHTFDTGSTNILTVVNSAGLNGMIPRPDRTAIAALFKSNPEYFVNNATADNYYNAFIAPRRDVIQTVTAAYRHDGLPSDAFPADAHGCAHGGDAERRPGV
jgi:iron complex outermembrane receptor protein